MGGTSGEIRGKSKIETYLKYTEMVDNHKDILGDAHPDPKYKKICKKLMLQDQHTGEWVLQYHLHT
jgi:hypothetical protein